jgi:hypothetical protein
MRRQVPGWHGQIGHTVLQFFSHIAHRNETQPAVMHMGIAELARIRVV